jgi:hypothetical protein
MMMLFYYYREYILVQYIILLLSIKMEYYNMINHSYKNKITKQVAQRTAKSNDQRITISVSYFFSFPAISSCFFSPAGVSVFTPAPLSRISSTSRNLILLLSNPCSAITDLSKDDR